EGDEELMEFMISQGFIKVTMPVTCILENLSWENAEEYVESLSTRSRRHLRYDVIKNLDEFEIEIKQEISKEEEDLFYSLYDAVSKNNFDLNYFKYPKKMFRSMSQDKNWEFIILKLKSDSNAERPAVAFGATYKNSANGYTVLIIGMDYDYLESHKVYKQALYQVVQRAKGVGANKVFLGFSAAIEKKKLGATIIPKIAFVQPNDNYNLELLEAISAG